MAVMRIFKWIIRQLPTPVIRGIQWALMKLVSLITMLILWSSNRAIAKTITEYKHVLLIDRRTNINVMTTTSDHMVKTVWDELGWDPDHKANGIIDINLHLVPDTDNSVEYYRIRGYIAFKDPKHTMMWKLKYETKD